MFFFTLEVSPCFSIRSFSALTLATTGLFIADCGNLNAQSPSAYLIVKEVGVRQFNQGGRTWDPNIFGCAAPDPIVQVWLGNHKFTVRGATNTHRVCFAEGRGRTFRVVPGDRIKIKVYDADPTSFDDYIGGGSITVTNALIQRGFVQLSDFGHVNYLRIEFRRR